jgi:hypothetical protein
LIACFGATDPESASSGHGLFSIDREDFMDKKLKPLLAAAVLWSGWSLAADPTQAFCGFYVAKADANLFNKASKVVVARRGEQTAVTMASDYQGDPKEFALVIPVPTVVIKEQIKVLDSALVDHLDAYSAPRLVEYFDPDPCKIREKYDVTSALNMLFLSGSTIAHARAAALGVKIEAEYTVGEYDILILSAVQSDGLATWLTESGYHIPAGAAPVLGSYIKQNMKFFVARVNLQEQAKLGYHFLRPIQVTYATEKFMLPIRLGTVNASGPQDMIVLMLSEKGRVEPTNYRTTRIPSNAEIPIYTKAEFGSFYRAVFDTQVTRDDMSVVYLEYAWNMGWCDPCAADPVPNDKLAALGASWVDQAASPQPPGSAAIGRRPMQGVNVFLTRLHVRYDAAHFPEDLMFQETTDRSNFQGRFVLRHPFTGPIACAEGEAYRRSLGARFETEASTLSRLTGWDIASIREKMRVSGQVAR